MEFADGKTRLTHVVADLSISDQQEADKLLGDPLSCHFCTVTEFNYLTPELSFPVKTASSVLKKVLDAAGGKIFCNLDSVLAAPQRVIAFGWVLKTNIAIQGEVHEESTLYTTFFMK